MKTIISIQDGGFEKTVFHDRGALLEKEQMAISDLPYEMSRLCGDDESLLDASRKLYSLFGAREFLFVDKQKEAE